MTAALLGALMFAPAGLFVAAEAAEQRRRRRQAARIERARTMPAEHLGDQPAVRAAEQLVYAAWVQSGQRRP